MIIFRYYAHYIWRDKLSLPVKKVFDSSKECFSLGLNFLISHMTGVPPLKVTQHATLDHTPKERMEEVAACVFCLNSLVIAYGYNPLRYSWSRADPVLFKDNVAAHRKEFRRLENVT